MFAVFVVLNCHRYFFCFLFYYRLCTMSLQRHHHYPPNPKNEGWVSTRVLEEVVLPAYSAWPCENHAGGSRAFHYPNTVPSTCRRALAVFCERQCAAQVSLTYVCCPGHPSSPLNVELKCGIVTTAMSSNVYSL